ncbi:WAP four-disulfide core domain protein 5-like [Ambystoma mexicanum]|uniref:WAP four-disulfide core domain protein 5-like n=1 Tax=Ambystoma mexicanum TaxID=8296 RepID=UPI0037E80FE2
MKGCIAAGVFLVLLALSSELRPASAQGEDEHPGVCEPEEAVCNRPSGTKCTTDSDCFSNMKCCGSCRVCSPARQVQPLPDPRNQ